MNPDSNIPGNSCDWAAKYATLHAAASAYFLATTNRKATEAAPALKAALADTPKVSA